MTEDERSELAEVRQRARRLGVQVERGRSWRGGYTLYGCYRSGRPVKPSGPVDLHHRCATLAEVERFLGGLSPPRG